MKRPAHHPRSVRVSPFLRQRCFYFNHRVDSVMRGITCGCRPRTQEPGQLTEIPSLLEQELGHGDFREREVDRSVSGQQQLSLGVPPWVQLSAIELMHERMKP